MLNPTERISQQHTTTHHDTPHSRLQSHYAGKLPCSARLVMVVINGPLAVGVRGGLGVQEWWY